MRTMGWGRSFLLVCAGLAAPAVAFSQTNGEIRGTAKDQSGGVVPRARVSVVLSGTATARSATTDANGEFDIPELPVGTYNVAAEASGFKKFVASGVVVTIGHVALVEIAFQVGGSAETVTVEANAVQVETTSTQLGAVMTDTAVRELPLSTRNTYELLQLQPGVQSQLGADLFYGSDNPGVVSVNGGRGRANNYMVNGGDGNDIFVNAPAIQPSPDAIEEFRVITNTFDAEYGRNSGSVVNVVTKSGTNQLHGDFYEFLRNQDLNTRGYFDPFLLDYKQNQFGGTLGGPIKKDRTFVFGSYEGNRLVQGISSGNVVLPTSAEAGGDFSEGGTASPFFGTLTDANFASVLANRATGNSGQTCQQAVTAEGGTAIQPGTFFSSIFPNNQIPVACFDPTALALYNQYVAPVGTGTISTGPDEHERGDQFTVRFDHKINNMQQFSAYYYFDDDARTDPFSTFQLEQPGELLPGFPALFKTRVQQWNLSHTWTIGSTAVNEFRFNYFREGQGNLDHPLNILQSVHDSCGNSESPEDCFNGPGGITTDIPGREGVPYIEVLGGFTIGNNFEGELPQAGNTFQWSDIFTKTTGNHTWKFGGDVRRQQFNQFLYYDLDGQYTFLSDANLCNPNNPNPTPPPLPTAGSAHCDLPVTNDVGFASAYPDYFIGTPSSYTQGAAQGENVRNTALYLFVQDSYKLKPNLTLNYGLRWELNTPYYDEGNRLQTFRPGQATTKYPCLLNLNSNNPNQGFDQFLATTYNSTDCGPNGPANAVFPLGLVFPGDPGVPRGLTSTDYRGFAPRIGLAWSPAWTEGWLGKLFGGPGQSSVRMGYGIFYNPIEQLVLEQFSAEPPFGGSVSLSNTEFNTPYVLQSGTAIPNVFQGIINQTPQTPCFTSGGPNGCVDWSNFRPILLFGEFAPNLKSQYAEQYNLTIERQISKNMLFRVAYVGTQAHHLLASHDLDAGNIQTCLGLINLSNANPNDVLTGPNGAQTSCGPFSADTEYYIPPNTVIPQGVSTLPAEPFPIPSTSCSGLVLPYNGAPGGNPTCLAAGTTVSSKGITLIGTRPYSSPNCNPMTGAGCPADGVPVFSNIFAEDTIANSNYNGLQISLDKSYSHGLLFEASYTFSKAIDQGASFENELNPLNYNATRGVSLLDAKHRFVFSPVWELPIPQYAGFEGKALDGWGVSAIITYQTGFPIRVQTQDDLELESSYFFEDANTPEAIGPLQFLNPRANGNLYFNTSNIFDPNAGTFGNLPHALCCGPALSNTDLVISKKTPLNERWNTEFRAEFYNTWNHTQFANPDGNFTDLTFGEILKTREGPRVMQFAMKFMF
ncbi:MAG TPA: carboxypeptidase regulatory-like domain-containing protein [Candidatus Cybelea sp.]|nr:carboxypeptidase regulatory-like domain-containing protein [Candidatus Cybelea sp.]